MDNYQPNTAARPAAPIAPRPANATDYSSQAEIVDVEFAECLNRNVTPESGVDLILVLRDNSGIEGQNGNEESWRSECSNQYGKSGTNFAQMTQLQATVNSLASCGWQGGEDLSKIETMIGMTIPYNVKWTYSANKNRWYKNVYIGSSIRRVSKGKAFDILRALTGGGAAPAAQPAQYAAPAPQQTASRPNPFARH